MLFSKINIDDHLREIISYDDPDYPLSVERHYCETDDADSIIPHWHEAIQFNLVTEGYVCYIVDGKKFILGPGEGILINSKHLHMAERVNEEDFNYILYCIDPQLLYGQENTKIVQKYITPLLNSDTLSACQLKPTVPWQNEILFCLSQICELYHQKECFFELKIGLLFTKIFIELLQGDPDYLESSFDISNADRIRLNTVLAYINHNYGKSITLHDIAGSIDISSAECCRFFKRALKQSPINYLNRVRISKAAQMLQNTDKSILEIAQYVGLDNASYFSDRFKKVLHCTPKEYRSRRRNT